MPDHACSLITKERQSIPSGVYTPVRFPYGANESYDPEEMHPEVWNNTSYPFPTAKQSALIRPAHDAWALIVGTYQFEPSDYTEIRSRINRDPFGPSPDWTATEHLDPSPGMQCFTKTWGMHLVPGVPIALEIYHNAGGSVDMLLAEFKVIYHSDPEPPNGTST